MKSTNLKLLLQAHLPFVEEPAYRIRRAMLVRDTTAAYSVHTLYTDVLSGSTDVAAVSRTSIARRNRYAGSSTNGRCACRSSFSFVLFTQLKKNCKNSIKSCLVFTWRVRRSVMANTTWLKLANIDAYL